MEKIFFETINNKKISCYLSEQNSSERKMVIMSHGFRGNNCGPARQFVDFQRQLNQEGYSVLRFDQPNSGNSDGDYTNSSFNEWIQTIVYFAKKYLDQDYKVSLLGQSMGATATVAATNHTDIKSKIPCILLWVPDAKAHINVNPNEVYEEGGQKYYGRFWIEARDSDFFNCLKAYSGGIHLVFGEIDRYVKKEYIEETIKIVKGKNQSVMILKGQDHSPWDYDVVQEVYKEEIAKLKQNFSP